MSVYFTRRGEAIEKVAVTNSLTHVTTSNHDTSVIKGKPYTATLTMESGYTTMSSVVVTMGGVDITSSAYNGGTISIATVTGDLVITAVATAVDYKTWYFNDNIPSDQKIANQDIRFTSRGNEYMRITANSSQGKLMIRYFIAIWSPTTVYSGVWISQEYRTVVFETEPTGELRTWLEANATPI